MIVADASWVVALRDPEDEHHDSARQIDSQVEGDVCLHAVTLAECLVGPARLGVVDDAARALREAFAVLDVDAEAPVRWAVLRAETGLRLPDAIVLDAALRTGARGVATFDQRLAARADERQLVVLGPED